MLLINLCGISARSEKKGGGGGGVGGSTTGASGGTALPVKTKEESIAEKKHELEKRLQDVAGQLANTSTAATTATTTTTTNTTSPNKKTPKKG